MKVSFFTGAGISASAGIPTYRDEGNNSWRDSDLEAKSHATRYGNHLSELWEKHWWPVATTMKSAEPTLAHRLIAQTPDAFVITQNIDGLHRRAGSENVMEFHGNMEPRCLRCKTNFKLEDAYGYIDFVPVCPNCDSIKVRPRVVLFGEMPSKRDYSKALAEFAASDYVVVVGSSLIVTPAAGLIMDILGTNTKVINVNPGKVAMSGWFHKNFTMGADEGTRAALEYIASA